MSLSKEWREYHLTPRDWCEGTFHGDALGGRKEVRIPEDRVLTIGCYDELPHAFAESHFYDQVLWKSEDDISVQELIERFGRQPDWFGYKMGKS